MSSTQKMMISKNRIGRFKNPFLFRGAKTLRNNFVRALESKIFAATKQMLNHKGTRKSFLAFWCFICPCSISLPGSVVVLKTDSSHVLRAEEIII